MMTVVRRRLTLSHLLVAGLVGVGILLAWLLGNPTLAWQVRAGLFGSLLLALLFLAASETSLRLHLYFVVLLLAFGWRTEQIAGVVVDAQQAFAWLLVLHMAVFAAARRSSLQFRGPRLAAITLFIAVVGYTTGATYGRSPRGMLTEMGPFLLSVPVIVGIRALIRSRTDYRHMQQVLLAAVLLMAVPGVAEYGLSFMLRRSIRYGSIVFTAEGFARANFTLWGGTVMGYALAPLLMLLLPFMLSPAEHRRWRGLAWLTFAFGSVAVYLSGHRGAWIAYTVGMVVFALLAQRGRLLIILGVAAGWQFLPRPARLGLLALFDPTYQTGVYDTSVIGRYSRMASTLEAIRTYPWLGRGFASAGWVHSDILQLAANLGIPATLMLLAGWYYPLYSLIVKGRNALCCPWDKTQALDPQLAAVLAAGTASLVLLSTQALIVISALALPVWIVIGLLWVHCDLSQHRQAT